MGVERVELRPDRSLIDSNFDGYKLSLDPLPVYERRISGVDEVRLSDDLYSYQHIKSFSLHNHLHLDPWNDRQVYHIAGDWSVLRMGAGRAGASLVMSEPLIVFTIPRRVTRVSGHYNVALQFVHAEYVVLSDGAGTLYLLHSDDRSSPDAIWQEHFSISECFCGQPFLLLHAVFRVDFSLDCLLLRIEESSKVEGFESDVKASFINVLEWVTVAKGEGGKWSVTRTRRLGGSTSIDYAALEPGGKGLGVVSESRFRFVSDSDKPLESEEAKVSHVNTTRDAPAYAWSQTAEEVTAWFKLAEGVTKDQVVFKLLRSHLFFQLVQGSGSVVVLDGPLFDAIDEEASTWTRLDNEIEVTLIKAHPGLTWSSLVKGDTSGEEILDATLAVEIQQRLAHLTTDQLNSDCQTAQRLGAMNPQQLEECDSFPVDSYVFARFSGESHQITNEVCLSSHQWLFSPPSQPDQIPTFCVRHDVDGLLWQPTLSTVEDPVWCCRHVATFDALGYVLASKRERKFLSCSPGYGLVALSDSRRHLYLYYRPSPLEGDLRNRKNGRRVANVARQRVVSLEAETVLGMRVTDTYVFVLSTDKLFVIRTDLTTATD